MAVKLSALPPRKIPGKILKTPLPEILDSDDDSVRAVRQRNTVMGSAGPVTKDNCAGEGQQQIIQHPTPRDRDSDDDSVRVLR
jgi:hypothetical protein